MQLREKIDQFWHLCRCRSTLRHHVDLSILPDSLSNVIEQYAMGQVGKNDVQILKTVDLGHLDAKTAKAASEVLKLFDASANAYRSVTNVLLEYIKIQNDLDKGVYNLPINDFGTVNALPLRDAEEVGNKDRCSVCGRFRQKLQAYALISGNPQTDSAFQIYRNKPGKRSSMQICYYCFSAGWIDLPTSKVSKDGNSVSKEREYLFVTTPLAEAALEDLIDRISQFGHDTQTTEQTSQSTSEEDIDDFMHSLQEKYDIEPGHTLAVIGLSVKRMREVQGFVLQGTNQLFRTLVLRVPVERLAGEDRISGAVHRELVKAAMYDFWLITGGSLHFGRVRSDTPFSVDGQVVSLNEMRRAHSAYSIAHRHARIGKYQHLNSGLFMLLLSHPRIAANRILNAKKREQGGRFAPGNERVKEIIGMTEMLAEHKDWQFQLGLKVVELLIEMRLTRRAKGFWKSPKEQYTGVELVKWIQRIKMVHDGNSARAWGTSLINGFRRENEGQGPNANAVARVLSLVEEMIQTCEDHETPLGEFARTIAKMDYYLVFYYNQNQSE